MNIKKHKINYIDIKTINYLVPKEFQSNINLLTNKDIPENPNNLDEILLYNIASKKESEIQQYFHKEFNNFANFVETKTKGLSKLIFQQIDNGDSAGGNLTQLQRMKLYKRKKAEGSNSGFLDFMILYYSNKLTLHNTIFCEVKKIGSPSEIKITDKQLNWFITLNKMGFDSYITNNPIFFRDKILKKLEQYFF